MAGRRSVTEQQAHPAPLAHRRVVVKVGSNVLTAGTDRLDTAAMAGIAAQIAELQRRGGEVILVTSGAITVGRHRLSTTPDPPEEIVETASDTAATGEPPALAPRDVRSRQVLAAVGQSRLMALWDGLFEQERVVIAQALLTRHDLADRLGYLNARNTLMDMIDLGVVPIVNENDVVSVDEISESVIGDNDNLSAQVANLVDADLLLLLTDIGGLYTADPARDPTARLIETVERIDETVERAAAGAPGKRGTGGMATKVQAARIATQSGTHVLIADGRSAEVLLRAAAGERLGTRFAPTGDRLESRRRYLLSGLQVRGRVIVDDGAARALLSGRSSLLPAGVTACEGPFVRGDVVHITTQTGRRLASGAANYSSEEVARIQGRHSNQIADVLGYEFGEEIVHRSNMVLV